jgi:hypothetical protein
MSEQTLTALFDTRGAAETARNSLIALSIASDAIVIRGAEAGTEAGSDANRGFWATLSDLFLPAADHHTYAEGVRRGGYLLSASVPDHMFESALEVLEQADPIDLDERAASWRASGWTDYSSEPAANGGAPAMAYSGGVALAEADPKFAPAPTPVVTQGDHSPDRSQLPGEGTGKAFAFVDNDKPAQTREVGRGSARVRSYVSGRQLDE